MCVKYWIASFSFLQKLISSLFTWVIYRLTDFLEKQSTALLTKNILVILSRAVTLVDEMFILVLFYTICYFNEKFD